VCNVVRIPTWDFRMTRIFPISRKIFRLYTLKMQVYVRPIPNNWPFLDLTPLDVLFRSKDHVCHFCLFSHWPNKYFWIFHKYCTAPGLATIYVPIVTWHAALFHIFLQITSHILSWQLQIRSKKFQQAQNAPKMTYTEVLKVTGRASQEAYDT
jgi:hypothetical protein